MAESFGAKTLVEIFRVVFTRLWGMLVIVAVVTATTWYASQRVDKVYTSSVTILAKQPQMRSRTVKEVSPDRSLEVFLKTQRELILSDRVAFRTVILLDDGALRDEWEKLIEARQQGASDPKARVNLESFLDKLDKAAEEKISTPGTTGERFRKRVRAFRRGIKVETPGGEQVALTEIFTIFVRHPAPPSRARNAARLLAHTYIERYRQVQSDSSQQASRFVEMRLEELREQSLSKAETALADFVSTKLKTPADLVILEQLSRSGTEAGGQIVRTAFEQEKIRLGAQIAELEAMRKQIAAQLPENPPTLEQVENLQQRLEAAQNDPAAAREVAAEIAKLASAFTLVVPHQLAHNSVLDSLKDQLATLIVERNKLEVRFQGAFRELTDVHFEIIRSNWEIVRELKAEDNGLSTRIATLRAQFDEITTQLGSEVERLNVLSGLLVEHQSLQHKLATARSEFVRMKDALIDAQTAELQQRNAISVTIVDDASLPDEARPTYPITWLYTGIAALAGMLLAFAYAFLSDYFDHTIRTINEAERYLGMPVLGSVRKSGRRLITS